MNPKYPIFIPTKGRADSRLTIKMFDKLGVPYTIFIEKQDYKAYAEHVDKKKIHVVPHKNEGVTVTRNYMWDYAQQIGAKRYWSFDDNIDGLYRFNHNIKIPCADATVMAVAEDFVDRYDNVAIAGFNYFMFVIRKCIRPPYQMNTRVYSNMLIQTNAKNKKGKPYRFATFYNEDTELCLRVLKDGWCTVLFNAFLIYKQTTMTMTGGNTEYYNKTDKRREFVEELIEAHPDLVRITKKWGRWHHQVNYSKFRQGLKRREGVVVPPGVNEYGMQLQEKQDKKWRDLTL